jgi:phosphoglycerate dehydrogenase-like enzyme
VTANSARTSWNAPLASGLNPLNWRASTPSSSLPRPELVHHHGVDYHNTVDVAALAEREVPLAITPSGTTTGVAEHTVLLTLAVLRRLPFADSELRLGRWHVNSLRPESRELAGMTAGYVGMGRMGHATAQRLRAFDTSGLCVDDPAPLPTERERALGLTRVGLHELLARADIVTLHTPLTAQTGRLVDAAFLSA